MSTIQSVLAEENAYVFMRYANRLKDRGVYFNRQKAKQDDLPKLLRERAATYLGKDVGFLNEESDIRLYIRDVFGRSGLDVLSDPYGTLVFDTERALLLHYRAESLKDKQREATGLSYYIAALSLEKELALLTKLASKNLIRPDYRISDKLFGWKRCPYIFRRYMLSYGVEEGYTSYVFERDSLAHVAFLLAKGFTYEEALEQLAGQHRGVFYNFLPIEVENRMCASIFSDELDLSLMNGSFSGDLAERTHDLASVRALSNTNNLFCTSVKPYMIDMLGITLKRMEEDLAISGYEDAVRVNHLSTHRVGFQIKDGVSVDQALPTLGKLLFPVTSNVDVKTYLSGGLL